MSEAFWRVGTLTVPSSTGTQTITGLGGKPKAVFYYGTNWLTEDAAVTTSGTGIFRGMAAPKYDDANTLLQNAASVTPAGDQSTEHNFAIIQHSTAGNGTDLYRATITSLDSDGFTLDWAVAASGGYKIVYVALMEVDNARAFVGSTSGSFSLGWKAGASLLHGSWGGPVIGADNMTRQFYGGGAYRGVSSSGWTSVGMTEFSFPTSAGSQSLVRLYTDAPSINVAQGGHFTGPFLVASNIRAFPSGAGATDFTFDGDSQDGGMAVVWDDEDTATGDATPGAAQGNTVAVSGLPFAPGLVVGYSISDTDGQATSGQGAAGFFVATPDFQWAALVDGISSRGSFQSFQRGFADVVNGTSVHAGTLELTGDGFVMTTEEDDLSPASIVWQAFGHPDVPYLPQFYRALPANIVDSIADPNAGIVFVPTATGEVGLTGGGFSYLLTGFVLLETGDRIILEEATGFLLL